jgi:hypothetical protein
VRHKGAKQLLTTVSMYSMIAKLVRARAAPLSGALLWSD